MSRADFMVLKQAVETLHQCEANYISSEHVRESFDGEVVWDGAVSLFGIMGHPGATMCYAWSAQEPGGSLPIIYAALRMAPIDSSRDAVRVSLALKLRVAGDGILTDAVPRDKVSPTEHQ